jgi:hypothetical protein
MLNCFVQEIMPSPAVSPQWCDIGLFFGRSGQGFRYCVEKDGRPRQRNLTAMRDQHFQELMSKADSTLLNGTSQTAKEAMPVDVKSGILDELGKQQSFRQFIKRKLPSRKPSPDLIQSIKDRIKISDPQESSI